MEARCRHLEAPVPLINTDGLVLIGPGSEWLWSAVSGLVLAITVVALYRQVRLQANATAIEQLTAFEAEWSSERLARYKVDILRELRAGIDPATLPEGPTHAIANFWERIGALGKGGHLDVELLSTVNLGVCQQWWGALKPWILARRAEIGPTFGEGFEWLAAEARKENDRQGNVKMDSLGDADELAVFMAALEYRIGIEVALRSDRVSPAGSAALRGPDGPPRTRSTAARGRS